MVRNLLLAALLTASLASAVRLTSAGDPPAANNYIGAAGPDGKGGCAQCHDSPKKGDAYKIWRGTKHAKAFEALASDDAKKIAKERGIEDPQKSEKCLKCHQTGYGEQIGFEPTFDPKAGVQCESCHGPGGRHARARKNDPEAELGKGEIVQAPTEEVCRKCHNKESPNFKPFCFKFFEKQIRHLDPRKEREDDELRKMDCDGSCGIEHGK